jgi:S-adenosylmethionine decarboxylase
MYGVRCDWWKNLNNTAYLLEVCVEAATASGNTVIDHVEHKFEPQGASVVLLLAESHLSVHTYPEHGYVSVDIYSCGGNSEPEKGINYLISVFKPLRHNTVTLQRGADGSCTDMIKSVSVG